MKRAGPGAHDPETDLRLLQAQKFGERLVTEPLAIEPRIAVEMHASDRAGSADGRNAKIAIFA
jgi:hypothetical protein